jgi:hypothetical protein
MGGTSVGALGLVVWSWYAPWWGWKRLGGWVSGGGTLLGFEAARHACWLGVVPWWVGVCGWSSLWFLGLVAWGSWCGVVG